MLTHWITNCKWAACLWSNYQLVLYAANLTRITALMISQRRVQIVKSPSEQSIPVRNTYRRAKANSIPPCSQSYVELSSPSPKRTKTGSPNVFVLSRRTSKTKININNLISIPKSDVNPYSPKSHEKHFVPVFLLSNVMSLAPKIDEVRAVVQIICPDFISITETWLQSHIHSNVVELNGYNLILIAHFIFGGVVGKTTPN